MVFITRICSSNPQAAEEFMNNVKLSLYYKHNFHTQVNIQMSIAFIVLNKTIELNAISVFICDTKIFKLDVQVELENKYFDSIKT